MLMSARDKEIKTLALDLLKADAMKYGAADVAGRTDACLSEAINILGRVDAFFSRKRIESAASIALQKITDAARTDIPLQRSLVSNLLTSYYTIEEIAEKNKDDTLSVEDWANRIFAKALEIGIAGIPASRIEWAKDAAFNLMMGKTMNATHHFISGEEDQAAVIDAMIERLASHKTSGTKNDVTDQMQVHAVAWSKTLPDHLFIKFLSGGSDLLDHRPALQELVTYAKGRSEQAL